MTTKTILEHTNLGTAPASADKFAVVDVSDTTDAASGTTKKVTAANVLDQYLANITSENLTDFSDVAITAPSSGEGLIYNSGSGDFENAAFSVGVGERDFVASGTIAQGDICIVNASGNAEAVSQTTRGNGTAAVFESASNSYAQCVYDTTNDRVVVAYEDVGNSQFGTACVGSISGTTITWGTPVVFESAQMERLGICFDSNTGNVVICYRDTANTGQGTAIVGAVSGLTISFGTAVIFEAAETYDCAATFDSTANKTVFGYRDSGNSNYGTAIVGTVSGTSISFGTAVVFQSAISEFISCDFSTGTSDVVFAFRTTTNHGYGVVGAVSGTSISFGTSVVFESASTNGTSVCYDPGNDKMLIGYTDAGNSNYGTSIVGTISGTAISYGSAVVFKSASTSGISCEWDSTNNIFVVAYSSTDGWSITGTITGTTPGFNAEVKWEEDTPGMQHGQGMCFNPDTGDMIIVYRDGGNSNFGTGIVVETVDTTNATAENVIGVATAAISDTATGTIKVSGGTSAEFAGLTVGSEYFVSDAGGATTTDTGRPLGRAISATEILLRTV